MRNHSKVQLKGKTMATKVLPAAKSLTLGIDTGDRWSEVCVLDRRGEVLQRSRVATTPSALQQYFATFAGARVAFETGTHSGWMQRVLDGCGLRVTVANAREVRKIHQSDRKNDRADAEILARMARFDEKLLSPVQHRSAQAQADISVLRARDELVRSRTRLINCARGLVKSAGSRLPKCSSESFVHQAALAIPPELQPALAPLLCTIEQINAQLRACEKRIAEMAQERYPEAAQLQQITGVGALTAVAFILTLGDKARFARSRDVGAYLGLVPRQYDSGDSSAQLRITKAGNSYMRRLLVGSAQYILGPFGPDSNLRAYGLKLAERGGKNAKKRAVVAVARKLAVLLQMLWNTGAVYEPLHKPQPRRRKAA